MTKMGELIAMGSSGLSVPDYPLIPYIEGDGIGPEIWTASREVFDGAVKLAYGGKRGIVWEEVLAGEKARQATGKGLPEETLKKIANSRVAIKRAALHGGGGGGAQPECGLAETTGSLCLCAPGALV